MSLSDLYKIEKIDGKGVGWIAQKDIEKGTLLLNEKPQICVNGGDSFKDGNWDPQWIKSVMNSFHQMSVANQKEFLTLHNDLVQDVSHDLKWSQLSLNLRQQVQKMYKKADEVEKSLSVLGIFNTNLWEGEPRVCEMKSARMNHSCRPNTRVWIAEDGSNSKFFVRTIAKIKAGEELTYSYQQENLAMKNRETRQKIIREEMNFVCVCDFCKSGQENQEVITAFQKLSEELKPNGVPAVPDFMKKVKCYKDMYNLARNNKTSWNFSLAYLYEHILLKGFEFAIAGYAHEVIVNGNREEEFKKECEKFSNAAKSIDDMLKTTEEERKKWQWLQIDLGATKEPLQNFLRNLHM